MRIVFCAIYYQKYLNHFFERNQPLLQGSYADMLDGIKKDYFGVYGSYADYAKKQGQEVFLILSNIEGLQKQWAKETGFSYDPDNWEMAIAIEQVKRFKPDVFFLGSIFHYYEEFLHEIKPYCKKIVSWISCPIPSNVYLKNIDLLLTSVPDFVKQFKSWGVNSELLPAAFDGNILNLLDNTGSPKDIPLSFIGGIAAGHEKRKETIEALARQAPLHWYGYKPAPKNDLVSKVKNILKNQSLEKAYKGEVWGMDMYRTLQRSAITFNAHIDIAGPHRVNMRMFEATGMGALLLVDKPGPNGLSYFEDGKEVITYSSTDEAVEKVNYYLQHPDEMESIAYNAQQKTLQVYNYDNNMQLMLSYFKGCLDS